MDQIRQLELEGMKSSVPSFNVGDTVDVHYLIREGDKERVQIFGGTVIRIHGTGLRRCFLVRRLVAGEGVERTFPLHSPRVQDIQVKARGKARRARLYYLRQRSGKAVRLAANFGKSKGPSSQRGMHLASAKPSGSGSPTQESTASE
ncbi:MAG: 50S ribosomal protein L19 [Planctomycetes bacterium]|nr:50S ribosomal protein L19 [Planctomycetota bacterium]